MLLLISIIIYNVVGLNIYIHLDISYYSTGTADNQPSEDLEVVGSSFEEQVNCLVETVFPKLGFNVLRWSKVPYLCEGDLDQSFYWLTDALFILNKTDVDINIVNTSDEIDPNILNEIKVEF